MKKLILLFVIIFCLTGISYATNPTIITYESKTGNVVFNHETHLIYGECVICHHTKEFIVCSGCHGIDVNIIKSKNAFHKQCKGCHKKLKQGPTKCKGCHIK